MDPRAARGFVEGYGRTWAAWDTDAFLDLFTDDVVYVAHPLEIMTGRAELRAYVLKEKSEQGAVAVRMGSPIIGDRSAVAEFWVQAIDGSFSVAGCLIFTLRADDGRCTRFREYWFDLEGTVEPFHGWGV